MKAIYLVLMLFIPSICPSFAVAYEFTLVNSSVHDLGNVTLSDGSDNTYLLDVSAKTTITITLPFEPTIIVIQGNTVMAPCSTAMALLTGAVIQLGWTNSNLIEIIDYNEQYERVWDLL
jgi:hypothetical protein